MPISPATRRGAGAFTLIELLVSVAVLMLLVIVLSAIFGNVSKMWQLGESNNERLQNIRAITDMISVEMRAALLPVNRTDKLNLQFVVNPTSLPSTYQNPDAAFWQNPLAGDQTYGDIAEVGYFVKWDVTTRPENPRPFLCRFNVYATGTNANFRIYSQTTGSDWITESILNNVAPADKDHAYEGLIAENVVALFVECRDTHGKPIVSTYAGGNFADTNNGFDSRQGFTDSTGAKTADFTNSGGGKSPLCVLPPIVKMSFVLIDAKSAARITPAAQTNLKSLAAAMAQKSPKGDASEFVNAALANPQLAGIAQGLRAYQTEILLQNAR